MNKPIVDASEPVVLITGASGIGAATAWLLLSMDIVWP